MIPDNEGAYIGIATKFNIDSLMSVAGSILDGHLLIDKINSFPYSYGGVIYFQIEMTLDSVTENFCLSDFYKTMPKVNRKVYNEFCKNITWMPLPDKPAEEG